ncbi:heparan-alpha-glucosaminide N-acetyltransferase domain-containing protein [Aquimarina hainanensis]|uniref:Heparan-alpha-glucosaminide N-acetyltransferase domain-containing protein n=1 Tax=Aquimarina hainanensis TaxID=1578017 RepID=A0ABW5NFE7_9FLAO
MNPQKKKNRILAIDFVRGFSVLAIIPVHCMLIYGSSEAWGSFIGQIIRVMEKGTPIFLVVMGISFAFSSRNSFSTAIKRGLSILALAYSLNIIRFVIPLSIGIIPDSFVLRNRLTLGDPYNYVYFFLLGDILQLAGLSLLLMAVINKISKNKYVILFFVLLIVSVSKELSGYRVGHPVLDYLCDLFWGNKFNIYFPVFPWVSFILIGLFFGKWYKELNQDAVKMYTWMWRIGLLFVTAGIGLCSYNYEYHFGDYYHLGPGGFVLLIGINLLVVWTGHIIVKFCKHNKFFELLYFASRNVTVFYIIQWILIYWGIALFGVSIKNEYTILMIIVLVTLTTFSILYLKKIGMKYLKNQKKHRMQNSLS